jgi:serine/threonine protein kinase
MGAVYEATHVGTKRTVAVKVVHPKFSGSPEFVERFRREAEASGRLRHPNIVDVTDFGFAETTTGQVAYLVMEYLDGRTLADVLTEEGRLSIGWIVDILEQVCSAVDEAHRLGIIHRDLKPDNVWLEPNLRGGYTVKVLDFGLAKLDRLGPERALESDARTVVWSAGASGAPDASEASEAMTGALPAVDSGALTRAGSVMGTPLYMSPEQCRGEELDHQSDVYSLGVIAYRMLTGETPFSGGATELVKQHCTAVPPDVRERAAKIPKNLGKAVMSALAKQPADRPESALGFAAAVRASSEGSGALLRRAVTLYSEHFPVFFKLSLLGSAPLIGFTLYVALADLRLVPGRDMDMSMLAALVGLVVGLVGSNLFAYVWLTAATAPLVVQLRLTPLRQPQIAAALSAMRRRWWPFAATTALVIGTIFLGSLFLIIPGVVAGFAHVLYAPVVIVERTGILRTLARARRLTWRVRGTVLIITVFQFALPVLVWIAAFDTDLEFTLNENWRPASFGFNVVTSAGVVLYQLLNVFITPLAAIMTTELYLKARHAGGEVLDATDEATRVGSRASRSPSAHTEEFREGRSPGQEGTAG